MDLVHLPLRALYDVSDSIPLQANILWLYDEFTDTETGVEAAKTAGIVTHSQPSAMRLGSAA